MCIRKNITNLAMIALLVLLSILSSRTALANQVLYWCEGGLSNPGKVYRANWDGSDKELLFSADTEACSVIALDTEAEKMYWTGNDKIWRADLDGNNVEILLTGIGFSEGLALDLASNKIYWASWGSTIKRAELDGTTVETLLTWSGEVYGLAMDVSSGKMYWTAREDVYSDNDVLRSNLDGTMIEYLLDGGIEPLGIAMDTPNNKMYWADWGGKVYRANTDGTDLDILYNSPGHPIGVAFFAGKIYWTEWSTKNILRANPDGSGIEILITTEANPWGIAVLSGPICGDLNGSGYVSFEDLAVLTENWLKGCSDPNWCDGCDIDKSGSVNFVDFAKWSECWPSQHILTASVLDGHGTISPTAGTYWHGEIVTLTATPDPGYEVSDWNGTDNDVSTSTSNIVTMYSDKVVTVTFAPGIPPP